MGKGILVVMSGGGTRMLQAGTGMLAAMEDRGILPDAWYGASAGGILAALGASNLRAADIYEIIRNNPTSKLFKMSWKLWVPGVECDYIYSCDALDELIDKHVNEELSSQRAKVTITRREDATSWLVNGVKWAVKATKAMPEVLPYITSPNGIDYVDGGVLNNVPVPPIKEASEWDHIYILLCNDTPPASLTNGFKTQRAMEWILKTMDREFQDIKIDWAGLPNVTVLQPPPYNSGLLSWDGDFKRPFADPIQIDEDGVFRPNNLVQHAYWYAREALADKSKCVQKLNRIR